MLNYQRVSQFWLISFFQPLWFRWVQPFNRPRPGAFRTCRCPSAIFICWTFWFPWRSWPQELIWGWNVRELHRVGETWAGIGSLILVEQHDSPSYCLAFFPHLGSVKLFLVGRKDDSIHEMVIWGSFPKYQRQRVKSWCFFLRKVHLADGFGLWIVCGCLQAQTVSHRTQESKVFWSMDYSSSRCEDTCGGILLPTILQHRITVMALIYKIWVQPYFIPSPTDIPDWDGLSMRPSSDPL